MFPILYESITPGIVPQDNGLGVLTDCISCEVEAERNGIYELTMEYPADGIHAEDIAARRILKVKPNFFDDPQLFRIDRIGKTMAGVFTVYGKHISYDLSGYPILTGNANNAESACVLLSNATKMNGPENPPDFTIDTDKEVMANFVISEPSSVKSWFVGREGSFLDVYGTAELKYNNFHVDFKLHAGKVTPDVTIRYGKNLLELSQESDANNLYSHVICYYKGQSNEDGENDVIVVGDRVPTGLTLDAPKVFVYNVSQEYQEIPTVEELTQRAQRYISQSNLTIPSDNITLDFVQSEKLSETVNLCDNVSIYYEALGITRAQVKCIRTKWDCLRERYSETEFGDVKQSLADTIDDTASMANNAVNAAEAATGAAASKKRVFITTPTPPYDIGDLWTDRTNLYVCISPKAAGEQFDEEDWSLAANYVERSDMEEAIADATAIITGGNNGYVVLHDSNNDRIIDEILIMDSPDINTAVRLWRWNAGGLAHSSNGYDGPYSDAAITADGRIVADFITAGTLDAQKIDVQHLKATMFEGSTITLGGPGNGEGVFELKNGDGVTIGSMDMTGLTFYGAGAVNARPYVKLDMNGLTGYDANGNWIFKVERDEFVMKKCVAQQEINACGKIKFVPVTTSTNNGVAIVAL